MTTKKKYKRFTSDTFYRKFPEKQQAKYKLRAMLKNKGYKAYIDNKIGTKINLDVKILEPKVVILLDVAYPFDRKYYIKQREIIESYGYKVLYLDSERVLYSDGLYTYNFLFKHIYKLEEEQKKQKVTEIEAESN